MTTHLDQEIKELEEKLGSLKAEQRLLEAQNSLNKEKSESLFAKTGFEHSLQTLQEKLAKSKLGLALSVNYKKNWVFVVRDYDSENGLSNYKVLDPKDKRVFFGLVDSFNQVVTVETIRTWFLLTLKLLDLLVILSSELKYDFSTVKFKSYDVVMKKVSFVLKTKTLEEYECSLVGGKPHTLTMSKLLSFDSEFSDIYFLGGGVALQTRANAYSVHDDEYLGNFEQRLTVSQAFTEFSELSNIVKELKDKLATFYEAMETRFE